MNNSQKKAPRISSEAIEKACNQIQSILPDLMKNKLRFDKENRRILYVFQKPPGYSKSLKPREIMILLHFLLHPGNYISLNDFKLLFKTQDEIDIKKKIGMLRKKLEPGLSKPELSRYIVNDKAGSYMFIVEKNYSQNKKNYLQGYIPVNDFFLSYLGYSSDIQSEIQKLNLVVKTSDFPNSKDILVTIADALAKFEGKFWGDREFKINFGFNITVPINIYQFLEAVIRHNLNLTKSLVRNIYEVFDKASAKQEDIYIIPFKDITEKWERKVTDKLKVYMNRLLETSHPDKKEIGNYYAGLYKRIFNYVDVIPNKLNGKYISVVLYKMKEIKSTAYKLIQNRINICISNMVLSYFQKINHKKMDLMVVTASQAYKDRLKIFSETPIVIRENESSYLYYGEPSVFPDSETPVHWVIHQDLLKNNKKAEIIIHIHSKKLSILGECGDIRIDDYFIPSIDKLPMASENTGRKIAKTIISNDSIGVNLKQHGQWFIGNDFEQLANTIIDIHKSIPETKK